MKESLTINLIPFRIIADGIDLFFSSQSAAGQKIKLPWVPSDLRVPVNEDGFTFWSLEESADSTRVKFIFFKKESDGLNRLYFTKRVLTQLLLKHFRQNKFVVGSSYVGDAIVWTPAPDTMNGGQFTSFDRFTLRIDIGAFKKESGIFLSYDGQSLVSKLPVRELNIADRGTIGKIVLDNRVYSRSHDDFPSKFEDAKVVLNREIEHVLGITRQARRPRNKYQSYYEKIYSFYDSNLAKKTVAGCFEVQAGGFLPIPESSISRVDEGSNLLEFKDRVPNVNVYDGLKQAGGPYRVPNLENLRILFIFLEKDREAANRLFSYLGKGYRNFPGLEKYVSVPFNVDIQRSLRLHREDSIIAEVSSWLQETQFEEDKRYFAFYISPINKDEEDNERVGVYYKLKEILLKKEISSQVIFKSNLSKPDFNFYLPNIAVATLAKLGGIPWHLPYPLKADLILGLGAYRNHDTNSQLIGNAICFRNDGQFEKFRVFPSDDVDQLANSLKDSIRDFIREMGSCSRVVIHYFKDLGAEERVLLDQAMRDLNLNVPYIFVTVNDTESRDYVVFDEGFEGRMPLSGTIVRLRGKEFLLCNNTRYHINTAQRLDGYPFPVKIRIQSRPIELTNDFSAMKEIINQVYEFSRIYWKSIRQRNKPVTIEYSEIIAKVVSEFSGMNLPPSETATKTLWFL